MPRPADTTYLRSNCIQLFHFGLIYGLNDDGILRGIQFSSNSIFQLTNLKDFRFDLLLKLKSECDWRQKRIEWQKGERIYRMTLGSENSHLEI